MSKDSNNTSLLIKESLLIARDKPILSKAVESFPVELFEWQNLIIVQLNKDVFNILNVTVKIMPWWSKAKAQQK